MSKEVAKAASKEVAQAQNLADWGEQELSSQDILISKILPMQGLSKMVTERKAQMGEYRDSVTAALHGSVDAPMEFLPFHMKRSWSVSKMVNGKYVYQREEQMTRENEGRQWEENVGGEQFRNVYTYTFFALLPKEIAKGGAMPYMLSFSSTSVKAGKKLATQMFVRNKNEGLTPASYVMHLDGQITKNDKGSFIVRDVSLGRKATDEEVTKALEFFKIVRSGAVKEDHSDREPAPRTNGADNMEF